MGAEPTEGWDPVVLEDGVGRIALRAPGGRARLSLHALRDLQNHLERLESLAAAGGLRAAVVATTPPLADVTGYDLGEILAAGEEDLIAWSHEAQGILRRLHELEVPTVAAIGGHWIGAGTELALACSARVAAQDSDVALGLPQVDWGLTPAWGGTVRLPQLIGLRRAAWMVISGGSVSREEALALGLIDAVLPATGFDREVSRFALDLRRPDRPARPTGSGLGHRLLNRTAPGRNLLATWVRRFVDVDPAGEALAKAAIGLMLEATGASVERAYARESGLLARVADSPSSRGRLHAHHLLDRASSLGVEPHPFDAAAVCGASQTGSDIAHLFVAAGIQVRLKDSDRHTVRQGVLQTHNRIRWEEANGRITPEEAAYRAERLEGVTGFGGFGTVDVVVAITGAQEAGDLLAAAEPHVRPDCVLAAHEWAPRPSVAQRALRLPARTVGVSLHFPVDRFPLMEIVPGELTGRDATETMRALAYRLGLVPSVQPREGATPGGRLLGAYLAESGQLLAEGATVEQVDGALEGFGFSVGPFHRADAIGTRRVRSLLERLALELGERFSPGHLVWQISGKGKTFYRYRGGERAGPDPSLPHGLSPGGRSVSEMISRRVLLVLINEAAKILQDETADPEAVELASLLALGFPSVHGGLLRHATGTDLREIVRDLRFYQDRFGSRYAPAQRLLEAASEGSELFEIQRLPGSGQRDRRVLT